MNKLIQLNREDIPTESKAFAIPFTTPQINIYSYYYSCPLDLLQNNFTTKSSEENLADENDFKNTLSDSPVSYISSLSKNIKKNQHFQMGAILF